MNATASIPENGKKPTKKNNNRCTDSGQNDDHCLYILQLCSTVSRKRFRPEYL